MKDLLTYFLNSGIDYKNASVMAFNGHVHGFHWY